MEAGNQFLPVAKRSDTKLLDVALSDVSLGYAFAQRRKIQVVFLKDTNVCV
jgi:hypothetical protein